MADDSAYDSAIETFSQYHEMVTDWEMKATVFRGVTRTDHELIPKIGRFSDKFADEVLRKKERMMFKNFKRRAVPFLSRSGYTDCRADETIDGHGDVSNLAVAEAVLVAVRS